MSTKSNKSSGTQYNPRGVTQGVTLVDPKSGNPIDTVVDTNGTKRLAVDANFVAQNVQATVELDFAEDSVSIGDSVSGNKLKIESDGSINANTEIDAADGDNVAISNGTNTADVNTNKELLVKDTDTETAIQVTNTKIDELQIINQNEFDETQIKLDQIYDRQADRTQVTRLTDGINDITARVYKSEVGQHVTIADGGQRDSFDRLRTSSVSSIINFYHSHAKHDLHFTENISGTASSIHNPNLAAVRLMVGTANGDSIIRQTKRYVQYNPGRSYLVTLSGIFGPAKANVRQRWGYFDDNNGFYFELTSSGFSVNLRSNTSGSILNTQILQANFNVDKLDGTGKSGLDINLGSHHLYVIDYVWQGAGRVRFGIVRGGKIVYCHEFINDNTISAPYTRSPSRPVRVELTNIDTTASSTTLDLVCISVNKESTDKAVPSYVFSANRGTSNVSVASGSTAPIFSLRPKLLFNGLTNRVPILPTEVPIISISNPLLVQIFLNPILTGASFVSAGANSSAEYDISATSITGGLLIKSFFVGGLAGQSAVTSFGTVSDILFLTLNALATTSDIFTIVVTNLGSGSTQVNTGIVWEEYP